MRKYLLLCTALTISSSAYAALDCATPPTCEEWGFTMTTSDCAGKFVLRCPREPNNDNAVFCGGENVTSIECSLGSILYDDLKCYNLDSVPEDKEPIAVVFDTTNRLAIGLNDASSTMKWSSASSDISGLTNYATSSTALTETTTGKQNTATIIALGGDYSSSSYAPGYCYNLTEGGQTEGSWFLPNLKELKAIYDNKPTVDTALTSAGGTTFSLGYYWSSTEYSSIYAWRLYVDDGSTSYRNKISYSSYVRCGIKY